MAGIICLAGVLFVLVGNLLALRRLALSKALPTIGQYPAVSILKPLKGADSGLKENLESFFRLDYPEFELLFSVADGNDPSIAVIYKLRKLYPQVAARLLVGAENVGHNPKVNNLARSYRQASHNLILISDSNVRVSNDYLSKKVALLKPGVGVVTAAVAGVNPEGWGARLEATYLNTFYTRGMNLAFATGNPCVVGKSMLFRRSDASRFGGIRALGDYLAEDYALGEQMRKLGLSVELMDSPIEQYIGQYSFRSFWDRHLRWGRIRKVHAPGAFLIEPLFSPLISSIAAGIALHGILGFILAASFWGACDFLLMRKMLNRNRDLWWIPLAWVLREFLALPLWMAVASGNSVQWRGSTLFLSYGGKIHGGVKEWSTEPSSGVLLPAHTKLRGTTKVVTGGLGKPRVILREG